MLFDLDGVLVDSRRAWYATLLDTARARGFPAMSYERFCASFGLGVAADIEEFFPGLEEAWLRAFYHERFATHLDQVAPMPGALATLQALAGAGLRRGVVTNSPRPLALELLERHGLWPWVETLAASGDAPEKPAPDLVFRALEALGLGASEALFVGDSETDAKAAAAAGIRLIGMRRPGDPRIEELAALPALCGPG